MCSWYYFLISYFILSDGAAAFEKGLTSGNFSSAEDNLQVWTAYLDYLRRRVRLPDNQVKQTLVSCVYIV